MLRIEEGDWLKSRCKLVRPDFVAGIQGKWSKHKIEKQTLDFEFVKSYMEQCHDQNSDGTGLPTMLETPRKRVDVVHKDKDHSSSSFTKQFGPGRSRDDPQTVVLPHNFRLWPGEVAIATDPQNTRQIQAFRDAMNVGLVITLAEYGLLETSWFSAACRILFVPILKYMPPTMKQMDYMGDDIVRYFWEECCCALWRRKGSGWDGSRMPLAPFWTRGYLGSCSSGKRSRVLSKSRPSLSLHEVR